MLTSIVPESHPEVLLRQGSQAIVLQVWIGRGKLPQSSDLRQGQDACFHGIDAARQAVPAHFNSERGRTGNDDFDRCVVNQRLQLRIPSVQILHFIEKEVRLESILCQSIESGARDAMFEPC